MKTRVITAIFITVALVAILLLSNTVVYSIALSVFAVIAANEVLKAYDLDRKYIISIPSYIVAFALPVLSFLMIEVFVMPALDFIIVLALAMFVLMIYLFMVSVFAKGKIKFDCLSAGFVLVVYITACFSGLSVIRYVDGGGIFNVGMVFIGAWVSDTFAYFTGRLLGKHKLIPEVSPKKTVEGSVGAIVFTTLLMLLYGWIVSLTTDFVPNYLVLGLSAPILSVVGQIGDLFASLVKRERGIKDYGKLLPGHGGIMDRFDSVLTVSGATMVITLLFTPFA
ncbi:MAG: hypothetical protein E7673_03370 [Ruminococcaceae bacterium]|nr:hypothetical protein [Oscillospiraceae bacterium]